MCSIERRVKLPDTVAPSTQSTHTNGSLMLIEPDLEGHILELSTLSDSMAVVTVDDELGLWIKLDKDDMEEWETALSHIGCNAPFHTEALHWAAAKLLSWMIPCRLMYPALGWDQDLLWGLPDDHPDIMTIED